MSDWINSLARKESWRHRVSPDEIEETGAPIAEFTPSMAGSGTAMLIIEARVRIAHEDLFKEAAVRVTRSWARDLRRLSKGSFAGVAAELHRTAKIRADWFDTVFDPPLACYAAVVAALAQAEPETRASFASQGGNQVAALIARIEATGSDAWIEEFLTDLLHDGPARMAHAMIESIEGS